MLNGTISIAIVTAIVIEMIIKHPIILNHSDGLTM